MLIVFKINLLVQRKSGRIPSVVWHLTTSLLLLNKQLQLEEFSLNLKQNKINKYGVKAEPEIASPVLNKNLRRRVDNTTTKKQKMIKKTTSLDDYTPSVFENRQKFADKRVVSITHEKLNMNQSGTGGLKNK